METPPPPVSPPTSASHGRPMMRLPPGAPPQSGGTYPPPGGAAAPSPPRSMPSHPGAPHHPGGPPHPGFPPPPPPCHPAHRGMPGPTGLPPGPRSPPSSNGGSRPNSMPGSPASAASASSMSLNGYASGGPPPPHRSSNIPPYCPPPPHGMPPQPGVLHSTSPGASPRGLNTPSPPPAHPMPGSAGSAKVTPDASARIARARATGEPPLGPPTWRRMPCKARSVPEGHTADTAYLTIPPSAQHGLVLACSHPECRQSGKRFRFCAVCDLPVAKRNFLKRHSHGLVSAAARSPRTDDDDDDDLMDERAAAPMSSSPSSASGGGGVYGSGAAAAAPPKKDADAAKKTNGKNYGTGDAAEAVGGSSKASSKMKKSSSESDMRPGPSAPTSKSSALGGSQYKRPREAGTTPPRDSDLDRENGSYDHPPYHGGPPINHAMSWPPHVLDGQPPHYHPGVDSNGHDAAARLGLASPYGYPAYNSPQGPHHHQMHHIPPHSATFSPGMVPPGGHNPSGPPYHSPLPSEYEPPRNVAGAFRGLPPNHGSNNGGSSSAGASPHPEVGNVFDPPEPEYSIMRLSRKEREWLQLYRARPDSSDQKAMNDWVNRCLTHTEPMDDSPVSSSSDGRGGGLDRTAASHATGLHSNSTVPAGKLSTITPPSTTGGNSHKARGATKSEAGAAPTDPANVSLSHDMSSEIPSGMDDLDLSPMRDRRNTGGSLSTLSMTGGSVTELFEHAGLMDADFDMPIVEDPGKGALRTNGSDVSDVSPISNHGVEDKNPAASKKKPTGGSNLRSSPEGAPPMPSLQGGAFPNASVRESLQQAKMEGERVASGRNSVRPSSPRVGTETPVNLDGEPSWGCSFLPPLCGAFNM